MMIAWLLGCDPMVRAPDHLDDPCPPTAETVWWYADNDGDNYGAGPGTPACAAPPRHVANDHDCDDDEPATWPGAPEGPSICGDQVSSCSPVACRYSGANELEEVASSTLYYTTGPQNTVYVSMLGDVDGDGLQDVGVGTLVVLGPGASVELPEEAVEVKASRRLSFVVPAGDADGDGRDDVLVIGYAPEDAEPRAGAWVLTDLAGAAAADEWGAPLGLPVPNVLDGAGLGDVDGDGFGEVALIGRLEPSEEYGMWLYRGAPDGPALEPDVAAPGHATSVAPLGDIDGDGRPDFAVGSRFGGDEHRGLVWLFTAPPNGDSPLEELASAEIIGDDYTYAGSDVDGAGDVDGDGYDDVLVGHQPDGWADTLLVGTLWVEPLVGTTTLADAHASFYTDWPGTADFKGATVSGAGDLDADGEDDFAIALDREGVVYLYYGETSGHQSILDADATFAHLTYYKVGNTLDGGADVDGDGFPDLLVASPGWEADRGMAFLVGGWSP
jgi:hypothetical protein